MCEYFFILILPDSDSFKKYMFDGFKNQILNRYKDKLFDIASINFIQKLYQMNIDKYPNNFFKLTPDYIIESTNKMLIFNEILDERESNIFISENLIVIC